MEMRDQLQALAAPLPIALTVLAFAAGYQLRSFYSTPSLSRSRRGDPSTSAPTVPSPGRSKRADSEDADDQGSETDPDSEYEDEQAARASDLRAVKANLTEEVKLVLVVNDSLKMTKGKIGAQCGHATLACFETLSATNPTLIKRWKMQGQPKIALRGGTTEELDALARQARELNLCARTIQDAGRTQVAPGSKTVLGIGPGPARLINTVTGKLKLL